MAALTKLNASVTVGGAVVHSGVTVAMDDASGTVIVKAVSGGVYGEVARFEGVEFLWRKGNLDSGYLLADGTPMEVAKAKGCGCG